MRMDPSMFTRSLDKMLEELKGLSDHDIGNGLDQVDAKPIAAVKITKISGEPSLDNDDDNDNDVEMNGGIEGDKDDDLTKALDEINNITGEKADPEWIASSGRDPRDFMRQFASGEPITDDEEDLFPEERISRILGNRKYH